MTPADLAALIHAVATDVLTGRGLGTAALPAEIGLGRARVTAHGDYSTAVALRAAPELDVPAPLLAGWLADELSAHPGIASAEVAGPGFLNLRLTEGPSAEVATGKPGPVYEVPANRVVRLRGGGSRTELVELAELGELVGRDTARFVLLRARPGATPVLDAAALASATDRNPAFRVRHAHARLCALERGGEALGVGPDAKGLPVALTHPRELEVLGLVGDYERVAAGAEADRLARHLEVLVEAFDRFEVCCPVLPLGDEPPSGAHRARLALVPAARRVLSDGLRRLDVSAPERM